MKAVVQRVLRAKVTSEGRELGAIGRGLLILLGVSQSDSREIVERMADKIGKLRIFEDENHKTNRSLRDVQGEILVVSQFTLYADCRKGNRPSFAGAGSPQLASERYEYFIQRCQQFSDAVKHGSFGAKMEVELVNDGPFTLALDSRELFGSNETME